MEGHRRMRGRRVSSMMHEYLRSEIGYEHFMSCIV